MADQMAGLAMPVPDEMLRAGGRRVGYRLSGADARQGLLYLHGTPSSRAEAGAYEPGLLEERGVCAVAVDRPGYGATDPLDDLVTEGATRPRQNRWRVIFNQ